jgi:hypothetical protein
MLPFDGFHPCFPENCLTFSAFEVGFHYQLKANREQPKFHRNFLFTSFHASQKLFKDESKLLPRRLLSLPREANKTPRNARVEAKVARESLEHLLNCNLVRFAKKFLVVQAPVKLFSRRSNRRSRELVNLCKTSSQTP